MVPAPQSTPARRADKGGVPFAPMRSWVAEEDRVLLASLEELGPRWRVIAKRLPARTEAMCRNRWQRIRDGAKYGIRSRNRCNTCGELKRGHTCQTQMCQLRAAQAASALRPINNGLGEGRIFNAEPHVEVAAKRTSSTVAGSEYPVGVSMPSGVPLLTVDVAAASAPRVESDAARFQSPDSFRLLAEPAPAGAPLVSVPAWAVPAAARCTITQPPMASAPPVTHSDSSAILSARLSGPPSQMVPPMPLPSRTDAHSFDLSSLLAPGSPTLNDDSPRIEVPYDLSAPASPAPPMIKGIPSFTSFGALLS